MQARNRSPATPDRNPSHCRSKFSGKFFLPFLCLAAAFVNSWLQSVRGRIETSGDRGAPEGRQRN